MPYGRPYTFPKSSVTPIASLALWSEFSRAPEHLQISIPVVPPCSLLLDTAHTHRPQQRFLPFPPNLSREAFVCKQTLLKVWGNEGKEFNGRIIQKTKEKLITKPP